MQLGQPKMRFKVTLVFLQCTNKAHSSGGASNSWSEGAIFDFNEHTLLLSLMTS